MINCIYYVWECLFFRLFCFSIVSMLFCSLVGMFFVTLGPFWSISALLWHKSAFFVKLQWVCQWFSLKLSSYELWNELNLLFQNTVSQVFLYFWLWKVHTTSWHSLWLFVCSVIIIFNFGQNLDFPVIRKKQYLNLNLLWYKQK